MKKCRYPPEKIKYLVDGFRYGFYIDHKGDPVDIFANNSKLAQSHPDVVRQKLQSEIDAGRIAGPFPYPPFYPFQVSPLNVKEKSIKGKYRLLHDLRYPYDDRSVNANIPDHLKTVKYSTVRDAIATITSLPPNSYLAKSDIADAYRLIPLHPSEYPKLGMYFDGCYYYDKYLPQGCGSSCRIFEEFATALEAIFRFYNPEAECQHMIDDFLFIAITKSLCQRYIDSFCELCRDLGIPLAPGKTTDPDTVITFLGITLDSIKRMASLPQDKLLKYSSEVKSYLGGEQKKISRKELESLVGKLSFAAAVVPARPFLHRLVIKIYSVKKPHHRIRITAEMRSDLRTWLTFFNQYNGITFFRSLYITPSDAIELSSDASHQGFGGRFGPHWIQARYPQSWHKHHITLLELYPLYVLITMFGHHLQSMSIRYLCDNTGVVDIIRHQSSKCSKTMCIVRSLTLVLIEHNIYLTSHHIPGKLNLIPDLISRFQVTVPHLKAHNMNLVSTRIPNYLLPENYEFE